MVHYFDSSALVKLVVQESGSAALRAWFDSPAVTPVSSDLARAELVRAVRRVDTGLTEQARAVLESVTMRTLPARIWTAAGLLDPVILRTLDAVHLAAALEWGDELEGFVTYDDRQADAVREHGVRVVSPR